eukprot:826765-Pyramimonas_sp.AAC.1
MPSATWSSTLAPDWLALAWLAAPNWPAGRVMRAWTSSMKLPRPPAAKSDQFITSRRRILSNIHRTKGEQGSRQERL